MLINFENIHIQLSSNVKHITEVACMTLSGAIENGIILSGNAFPFITIYKDRIDFGKSQNAELEGMVGFLGLPNFYMEYGSILYRFDSGYSYSVWSKKLDYTGLFAPIEPDNIQIFNLLYPKFI